ncbi:MAG TPA: alpha/beta fold hydrolase [Polyangia bacterium]|nr:alpha/beta fold hydrolase [Polyangia bacterium]
MTVSAADPRSPQRRWRNGRNLLLVLLTLILGGGAIGAACDPLAVHRALVRRNAARAGLVERQLQLGAGRLHFYEGGHRGRGAASPVLLIHGFGAAALETWERQIPMLAEHHWVIAPDLFWFGESVPDRMVESAADQADALAELLGQLGARQTAVVGVSYGGFVAIELARRHPEQVGRLVLVDAAGLEPTAEERARIEARFAPARSVEQILMPADEVQLRALLDRLIYRPRYLPGFFLRHMLRDDFEKNKPAKLRICRRLDEGMLAEEALRGLTMPALLIWGRHDPLVLPSMGERMARALPHARLVWFEESAHVPPAEEPHRFNRDVLDFLAAAAP